MKIEVRTLVNENEMLSHIFLGCMSHEEVVKIKDKFVGEKDWQKESVKIPVEMKIGGISVNPKEFFDNWENQMSEIVLKKAKKLVSEKLGSEKLSNLANQIHSLETILDVWEKDINWDVENPFNEK